MRICSLHPGATEIACALGLADKIVGVSHECDFPASARSKPVMVKSRIDPTMIGSSEIDGQVGDLLRTNRNHRDRVSGRGCRNFALQLPTGHRKF
jgi:iron complex transport system substrate-binding protein